MRVLLTGATGFVGQAIRERLVGDGLSVVGLGRRPVGESPYVAADLSNLRDVEEKLEGIHVDAIVHAAADIGQADSYYRVNVVGTENVCKWAVETGVKVFIYISSIPVVGRRDCPIVETMELNPESAYHITKAIGEKMVLATQCSRTVVLRFASPVGALMPEGRIFSEFVRKASSDEDLEILGDGQRIQNYIPVGNVADAVLGTLRMGHVRGIYHLSGESISDIDLARRIVSITGAASNVKVLGRNPEAGRWIVSGEKFFKDTGIIGRESVDDIIVELAHRFRRRG